MAEKTTSGKSKNTSSRKNTTTKKTTTQNQKKKNTSKKSLEEQQLLLKEKREQERRRQRQFHAVIVFVVGIFLLALSLFDGPAVWGWLHKTLRGFFGVMSYAVGPVMIYIAVMMTLERDANEMRYKILHFLTLMVLLCGITQLFFGIPEGEGFWGTFKNIYQNGYTLKSGGLMAALFGWPLMHFFGTAGAAVIQVLLLFVYIMCVTGATLIGFFRSLKKPVEKIEKTYTEHRERREEKARQQQERQIDIPLGDTSHQPEKDPDRSVKAKSADFDAALKQFGSDPAKTVPKKERPIEARMEEPKKEEPVSEDPALDQTILDQVLQNFNRTAKTEPAAPETAEPPLETRIDEAIRDMKQDPANAETVPSGEEPEEPFEVPEDPQAEEIYHFPPITLLNPPAASGNTDISEELRGNATKLVETLKSFGVSTRIVDVVRGPSVTRYELQPSAGVKISKITSLSDDIALSLATAGVRIEAPIPNKSAIGIEVPNRKIETVTIREIVDTPEFRSAKSRLTMALGKDISGTVMVGDVADMPHLLIAGSTGSGKSVCINSIIISLLYKSSPDEVKFLMIDPKVVELGVYNGIPHLLVPVVTDPKKASGALGWAVTEMLKRYKVFADSNVRDLKHYNALAEKTEGMAPMPQIVIIIDELADLMMAAPSEVEDSICRLAQMARAAGMHLIIATQRPSTEFITGAIKTNIPSRIAFSVSSQIDSRIILDATGAEKLLGRGDMLYSPVGLSKPLRIQGCYVSDSEVEAVVEFVKGKEEKAAEYDSKILEEIERQAAMEKKKGGAAGGGGGDGGGSDVLFDAAVECVLEAGQASSSYLQRRLKVGYARAARLVDELEERGIVGPPDGSKPRVLLITSQQWAEIKMRNDAANVNQS